MFKKKESEIPMADLVQSNLKVVGGEYVIDGLTQEQAESLLAFAQKKGVDGEMKIEGAPEGVVQTETVTVNLGHTADCHKPLYEALGLE